MADLSQDLFENSQSFFAVKKVSTYSFGLSISFNSKTPLAFPHL